MSISNNWHVIVQVAMMALQQACVESKNRFLEIMSDSEIVSKHSVSTVENVGTSR